MSHFRCRVCYFALMAAAGVRPQPGPNTLSQDECTVGLEALWQTLWLWTSSLSSVPCEIKGLEKQTPFTARWRLYVFIWAQKCLWDHWAQKVSSHHVWVRVHKQIITRWRGFSLQKCLSTLKPCIATVYVAMETFEFMEHVSLPAGKHCALFEQHLTCIISIITCILQTHI